MVPLDNVLFYLKAYGGCFLPHNWGRTSAGTWLGGVLAALSLWGAARKAKWDWTEPAVLSLGAALGMHVFWGWQYERYLLPLLPLILYTAAGGLPSMPVFFLAPCSPVKSRSMSALAQTQPHVFPEWRRLRLAQGKFHAQDGLASLFRPGRF